MPSWSAPREDLDLKFFQLNWEWKMFYSRPLEIERIVKDLFRRKKGKILKKVFVIKRIIFFTTVNFDGLSHQKNICLHYHFLFPCLLWIPKRNSDMSWFKDKKLILFKMLFDFHVAKHVSKPLMKIFGKQIIDNIFKKLLQVNIKTN